MFHFNLFTNRVKQMLDRDLVQTFDLWSQLDGQSVGEVRDWRAQRLASRRTGRDASVLGAYRSRKRFEAVGRRKKAQTQQAFLW